ncbi:PREDICTED: uncharacterized protein LOC104708009 [Camelina sativa]|uniref:Uncharacterized protein LOC104708009 n=1 Tax=Camelina sativa TaxID=90675 RepID=A0ABM0T985_CAMSA|nr:PREDICTED: uncharacterized protein LOC104708009 [Camelina sativa]
MKRNIIQEVPRDIPNTAQNEDGVSGWQIWNGGNGLRCPKGTIPIRRFQAEGFGNFTERHEYAVERLNSTANIYGTKFTMSVGHPKVAHTQEFSLGQTWLASGSFEGGDLNTIEAGWQVFPTLYFDNQARLFIYWTNNAYASGSCYNLRCPGFIQTSGNVLVEGAIHPHTAAITIQIWKDPTLGHWWLSVGPNSGTELVLVGYWPNKIFTRLNDHAQKVDWGGEIVDTTVSNHTTTQMGSGYRPRSARAAYMRDLEVMFNTHDFQPIGDVTLIQTNAAYYNIFKTSDTSFTYGGPDYAGTVHLRVNVHDESEEICGEPCEEEMGVEHNVAPFADEDEDEEFDYHNTPPNSNDEGDEVRNVRCKPGSG